MPFAFIILGSVFLVSGVRGTGKQLITLIKGDFTGANNFAYWLLSILVIGAIGYVPELKPISRGFMALVILVLFLKNGDTQGAGGGFFEQFQKQAFGSLPTTVSSSNSEVPFLSQNLDANPAFSSYVNGNFGIAGLQTTNPDITTTL